MQQERSTRRRRLAGLLALALLLAAQSGLSAPDEEAAVSAAAFGPTQQPEEVVPLGCAVGIKLFSQGVLVVGLSPIETSGTSVSPGRAAGLKTGDVITHINGQEVNTIEQVQALLKKLGGQKLTLRVLRGEKTLQLAASAVQGAQGAYQLGVWLRDSMAGIGTLTFYDPDTGVFAALGHGINDVDTAMLMPLHAGSIMPASVSEVKKGESGSPGELHGQFDLTRDLGTLYANTNLGIFGQMPQETVGNAVEPVEVASRDQVETGPATIWSNIRGDEVEQFSIEILRLYPSEDGTRSMMVEVTDPALLAATGGIVQGMSGSPVLQNGSIVGAVTHVLLNDPTKGYGILIDHMLEAAGNNVS